MTTVREIESFLYSWAPRELAESWDNVGLLVGDPEAAVERVLVALDITPQVAEEALERGCQLIVAHHPVMNCAWHPVQTVRADDRQGRTLTALLRGGVRRQRHSGGKAGVDAAGNADGGKNRADRHVKM